MKTFSKHKMRNSIILLTVAFVLFISLAYVGKDYEGSAIVKYHGYDKCIELKNSDVRIVLGPDLGGRILGYELNGNNVLYHNPKQDGIIYKPGVTGINPDAGRCDIGPEMITPSRPALFLGKWEGEITGDREGRLISQKDTSTGVQLIRNFKLDERGSRLTYTQIIKNISNETKYYCHWSRTFVKGGGISLSPLNTRSRFPKGYLLYGPGRVMDFRPADEPNVRERNGILEIIGAPGRPKFVFDLEVGWLAYITKDNQLFVKKFPVYPDRVYGEMSAANACVWYNTEELMCEIEPIGPMETIKPGEEVSFTETWYLFDYKYPEDKLPDQEKITSIISKL